MTTVFGLDFGTSNTALSVNVDGEVSMIDIDPFNPAGKTLKSVIYYDEEERSFHVGQEAVDRYVDNDAFGRYVQSVKTFLPDPGFESTEVGRKQYTLEALIAMILKTVRERGEAAAGRAADTLVLGRPVVFSENPECEKMAEERLVKAAKLAGFREVHLQYEPIAAALTYEASLGDGEEKTILVGDFGGGTSDFTILRTRGGDAASARDRKGDVLGLSGVYIGGDTFDSALMWNRVAPYFGRDVRVKALYDDFDLPVPSTIMGKLRNWHQIPQLRHPRILKSIGEIKHRADRRDLIENLESLIEDNYGYMLFQAIEAAKCRFSEAEEATIAFGEGSLAIRESLAREAFDTIIHEDVERIRACVEEVLAQAALTPEGIDAVFLTGGSSNILKIRRIFADLFGADKIDQTDVVTSVAHGLGVDGHRYR